MKEGFEMSEFRRGTKLLLAVALCVSMVTSMLVLVPHKAGAAPQDGWIEGTVSDGVNPIQDVMLIYVLNMGGGGDPLGFGLTDALGHYNLTVAGGMSYMVLAFEGDYYSNASIVSVVSGATTLADINLTPIAPTVADVTLRGFVKNETGSPVTGGTIIGFTNDPLMTEGGAPYYGNTTVPDGLGEFSLKVIAGTAGGGVGIMGIPGYGLIDNSTSNPFISGMTYWLNLSLAPLISTDDAVIRGNVTDSETGLPLGNVLVNFESSNEWNMNGSYSNYTFADSLGLYNMNVTNGTSNIMFSKTGYGIYRLSEMSVNHGDNLRIDASLLPVTATVSGNVTDASLAPIANAQVLVFDQTRNNISYAITNSLGKFTFDVFDGDNLSFGAQASGYGSNWTVIDILPGDSIWHDFVLIPYDAWMTGRVTNALNGFPIENAYVEAHSSILGASDQTNSMGYYNISLVSGTTYTVNVDATGYGHNSSEVAVATGENVYNVELMPLDAWMTGKVTDKLSGLPIENAGVWVHSPVFDAWDATDSAGDYYVTLVSGITYTVDVNTMGYRYNTSELAVVSGENLYDVQLLPNDLPQTTRLYGWIIDRSSLSGIADAQVQVGLPPPDYGGQNQTMTGGTGYYEMWVAPVELMYVVKASNYAHSEGVLDATGQTDMNLTVLLDPDIWDPNVTYSQSPTVNISSTNPSAVHVEIQEQDPEIFSLFNARYDHTTGTQAYYCIVQNPTDVFDPLSNQNIGLPYSHLGDVYTVDYQWSGTGAIGGWLTNTTGQAYYGSYEMSMGPNTYDALRGYYSNSSMPGTWREGTAWFERSTGNFLQFQYDAQEPWADASDVTGLFIPAASMIEVDTTTGTWTWQNGSMGSSSVVGLTFTYNGTLPSGAYVSLFRVRDFAGHEWWTPRVTNLTVDNDIPVASAGDDQVVVGGQEVFFSGSLSSDSSGIANWTWTFTYGGTDYVLWGEYPSFTFSSGDDVVTVTLTVTDGAGHTSTDTMQVTVAGVIPEFPTMLLPVMGILALFALVSVRRRFEEG
jgi:hypothetical protein